jgi:hypothetical protein
MKKILHVYTASAIPNILRKYQLRLGHKVDYITELINNNRYAGFDQYYGGHLFNHMEKSGLELWSTVSNLSKIKPSDSFYDIIYDYVKEHSAYYDVIHVHNLHVVPYVRKAYPNGKIILHYHGDDLRVSKLSDIERYEKNVDHILVSTPDLLEYGTRNNYHYLPNPVDTDLFCKRDVENNGKIMAIKVRNEDVDVKRVMIEKKYSMPLTISLDHIRYEYMPNFLAQNEYYADVKTSEHSGHLLGYSATGLQALAVGVKVINYNLDIDQGLPDIHKPENVVKQLDEFL